MREIAGSPFAAVFDHILLKLGDWLNQLVGNFSLQKAVLGAALLLFRASLSVGKLLALLL